MLETKLQCVNDFELVSGLREDKSNSGGKFLILSFAN